MPENFRFLSPKFLTISVAAAKYETEAKQAQASLSMCFRFAPGPGLPLPLSLILVRAGKKKWERRGLPRFSFFSPRRCEERWIVLAFDKSRSEEGGGLSMWHTFLQPTNPSHTNNVFVIPLPPSFPYRPWMEGRRRGRKAKASKSLSFPPPQIPFRYTKSCGAPAKKDGRGEKISRHAKSGRMWRMRDEPRASGGKGGGLRTNGHGVCIDPSPI